MSPTPTSTERAGLARGGVLSFAGAATSAALGFAVTVVIARVLGDAGSGVVLQAIGVFSIVVALAKLGLDSVSLWLLPRLELDDPGGIRGVLAYCALLALVVGTVAAVVLAVLAETVWADSGAVEVARSLRVLAWFVPVGALLLIVLAATRALGGVRDYVLLGNIALPVLRPIGVLVATAVVAGPVAATLGWAAPTVPVLLAAGVVLVAYVRRMERRLGARPVRWPDRARRRQVLRFAWPRTLSAGLEQGLVWLDVVLVGLIAGAAAAGVYGAASRFVAAGLIVDAAIRVVVAPRFSVLLHAGRLDLAQDLYRVAATWLVLFATPAYVLLAVFAPTVLGWLGPGFEDGAVPLAILCGGAVVTFMAGNIHSLLLMSGRSGWAAFNKAVVLSLNVGANLLVIPRWGIVGAAVVWAVSMVVDAVLATVEVRRLVGVAPDLRSVGFPLLLGLAAVGVPAVGCRLLLGQGTGALVASVIVGCAGFAAASWWARARLHLSELSPRALRRGADRGEVGTPPG